MSPSIKWLLRFLFKISIVIAAFYIYLYFDEKRQHEIMAECDQLIPTIEASVKNNQYPTRRELSSSINIQLLNKCTYTAIDKGYRFAVAGTTFNFSLYLYISEQQRWVHE